MPPGARRLIEEGVVIPPTYLIRKGEARWDAARRLLLDAPFPTRAVEENLADLRAAVAANHRGAEALQALAREHGRETSSRYMTALKARAEERLRRRPRAPAGRALRGDRAARRRRRDRRADRDRRPRRRSGGDRSISRAPAASIRGT